MANQKKPININKYRRPLNINIGVIIFAVMFMYILICVIMFFTKNHVNRYEVRSGSLSISNVYDGIIVRDEIVISANSSGYVNYFAREGEHVANSDLVYTIDQSGRISEILQDDTNEILLSGNDLGELRNDFIQFSHNYKDEDFGQTYDFSYDMQGTVLKLSNYNMLNNLQKTGLSGGSVEFCYAPRSGIVVYNTDGYEDLTPEMVTVDMVTEQSSQKEQLVNNTLVGSRDPVYKMITSEDWYIVIAVDSDRVAELQEEGYVEVKFMKNQYTSWAKVNVLGTDEDKTMIALEFNNSMITFASDRYLDVELKLDIEKGLKIPNSSIVEKEFYLIPKEYLTQGGDSADDGFMRETFLEDGTESTEFVKADIYYMTDTEYYVDTSVFRIGDYIIRPDSSDKYPISRKGTLIGVYNMNKGYADFTQITILYQNKEYAIVKSNTDYGLNVYDHIVLDGNSVNDNDFVFGN